MGRRLLLLGVMSVVAACGGGGGGGSSSGGGGGGGGGAAPFQFTESNALDAGQYAFGAIEQALFSGAIAIDTAIQLSEQGGSVITQSCGATAVTLRYEDRDATATVTRGDVVRFQHGDCGGTSRNITLTLSTFDLTSGSVCGRLELDNSIDSTAFRGELTLTVSASSGSARWRASDVSLTLTSGGTQQTVRAGSSELIVSASTYQFSIAGGSVDSAALGGSYTFETTPPLTGTRRRLPAAGALVLTTSSASRASFGPPSAPTLGEATMDFRVAPPRLDYGPARQSLWTHLARGYLFEWQPNRAPAITNLTIQPTNPTPGVSLFATYNVTDPDLGDTLTIEITWQKNGVVVATNTPTLAVPLVRNDVVTVTVSVSDGREATPTTRTATVTIGNRPPLLTSLQLTPESPDTTADLAVVATANDPDGDPLRATYLWKRNGTVLDQYTTAVLPASETTRGDTISVTVSFDDDGLSVSGTAVAAIVDSPPHVVVGSAPPSTTYGMPTEFTATIADADADPLSPLLRFELAHGPAGMAVDPVSGRVTWTPSGPMFDRTLDVSWGVTLNIDGSPAATGTVRVEDPARTYPLLRTGIQIPLLGALRIGDFDDDGDTEMLLLGVRWLLEIEADGTGGYRQSWAYPFAFDVDDSYSPYGAQRAMTTGDVDGDGKHEIFVGTDNGLVKLDGAERRVVASADLEQGERCIEVELGDIDRDGAAEVVCAVLKDNHAERAVVYRADDLSVRVSTPLFGNAVYGANFALGNVDADVALEIVTSGGDVIDGKTAALEWRHPAGFGRVALGDIDGNGVDEIVATEFTELVAYRANVETELFRRPVGILDSVLVADLDGDGRDEILTGDSQWGNVTAYRYNAGTTTLAFQIDSQDHGVSAFGVGDVDGDSEREIVWGTGLSSGGADSLVVAGLHPGIDVEWTNTDPIQLDGPFVGGALASGPTDAPAPVFVTKNTESGYSGSRAVRLDPIAGTLEISPPIDTANESRFSMVASDDYDSDGTDELLLAGIVPPWSSTPTVYDFFADNVEWQPPPLEPALQIASGNVYGDSRDELVSIGVNGVVSVFDVATRQRIWYSDPLPDAQGLRLADIDGNGTAEVFVMSGSSLWVFLESPSPGVLLAYESLSLPGKAIDVAAGDTELGDGRLEIFVLVDPPDPNEPSLVVPFDSERRPRPPFALPWRAQAISVEPSSFARKNLLVSRKQGDLPAGRLVTVDPRNGAIVSESPPLIGGIGRDSVHYVRFGSGQPRISIGTDAGMYLTR